MFGVSRPIEEDQLVSRRTTDGVIRLRRVYACHGEAVQSQYLYAPQMKVLCDSMDLVVTELDTLYREIWRFAHNLGFGLEWKCVLEHFTLRMVWLSF